MIKEEEMILNKQRDNAFKEIIKTYENEIVQEKERLSIELKEEHDNWTKEVKT
jgi:hypothetical protein